MRAEDENSGSAIRDDYCRSGFWTIRILVAGSANSLVGFHFGEFVTHDRALFGHQFAERWVVANRRTQLEIHGFGVCAHFVGVALLYAQVIDQLSAFNGIALIKNVFVDCPGADAALGGDVAQLSVQILLTPAMQLEVKDDATEWQRWER